MKPLKKQYREGKLQAINMMNNGNLRAYVDKLVELEGLKMKMMRLTASS